MGDVTLVGNVGADPELRFTSSGKPVCTFSVAENRKRGEESESHWFDVTCWNALAENVAESVVKGTRIIVVGRLEQRKWTTDSGDKRSKVEVIAWQVGPDLSYATCSVTRNERDE